MEAVLQVGATATGSGLTAEARTHLLRASSSSYTVQVHFKSHVIEAEPELPGKSKRGVMSHFVQSLGPARNWCVVTLWTWKDPEPC